VSTRCRQPHGRPTAAGPSHQWYVDGLITAALFVILLVVFIAENTANASIHFLGFNGHVPLGLTILISAIIGLLIAAVLGSIRIMQLRRTLKRNTPPDQRVGR
jgi:uncharacterized integral membrane protein